VKYTISLFLTDDKGQGFTCLREVPAPPPGLTSGEFCRVRVKLGSIFTGEFQVNSMWWDPELDDTEIHLTYSRELPVLTEELAREMRLDSWFVEQGPSMGPKP
jgi:hypothetical protein